MFDQDFEDASFFRNILSKKWVAIPLILIVIALFAFIPPKVIESTSLDSMTIDEELKAVHDVKAMETRLFNDMERPLVLGYGLESYSNEDGAIHAEVNAYTIFGITYATIEQINEGYVVHFFGKK
ncbi:hypothetical protein [Paenisporosarcina cavernae]|uniref:Uncharacterized protein n=1 Tax=Paenisporosarcina cavernae TaxID=2320858 RepID=A0A385YX62_9BACL|nr:hypothetical protein [Paenisporosarcina cavernae]AYC30497.1 hypothetical protein D3873_11885 [Paenisporosarcina cavernae]